MPYTPEIIAIPEGIHESMPGRSILKMCLEMDYGLPVGGCFSDGVNTSGLTGKIPYWDSKFDLGTGLHFMPAALGSGLLASCPTYKNQQSVGPAIYTGVQYHYCTWFPATNQWTLVMVCGNPRLDIGPSYLLGWDSKNLGFQAYLGAYFTGKTTVAGPITKPLMGTTPNFTPAVIHLQVDHASAGGTNLWWNGTEWTGIAGVWDMTGVAKPTTGTGKVLGFGSSSQYNHRAIYAFDGTVDAVKFMKWLRHRFPDLSTQI